MDITKYINSNEILQNVADLKEVLWVNNDIKNFSTVKNTYNIGMKDIECASQKLEKYASLIKILFPETKESNGIIESELRAIDNMKDVCEKYFNIAIDGRLMLKMDSHLPIAGSIKARGGIYEVLKHAEDLALKEGLITENDNYSVLASKKDFFEKYTVQVGSTGNLGLSIGIMSAKLGFKTIVHMSVDAKEWKKELLRSYGVKVIEYATDYSHAVEIGRNESKSNPLSYFVDDENSINLFMGYSVSALRLKKQLENQNILVNDENPLFVYLPCGIGGAPGGVAFGLKQVFGDNVHCFFVEPTHAPCMLVGMATKLHDDVCVQDFGIDGKTQADGLAVGRASKLVGRYMENLLSGVYTIDDSKLNLILKLLYSSENIFIEPSACASFEGVLTLDSREMKMYIKNHNLTDKMNKVTHIAWATGGALVPDNVRNEYLKE